MLQKLPLLRAALSLAGPEQDSSRCVEVWDGAKKRAFRAPHSKGHWGLLETPVFEECLELTARPLVVEAAEV